MVWANSSPDTSQLSGLCSAWICACILSEETSSNDPSQDKEFIGFCISGLSGYSSPIPSWLTLSVSVITSPHRSHASGLCSVRLLARNRRLCRLSEDFILLNSADLKIDLQSPSRIAPVEALPKITE